MFFDAMNVELLLTRAKQNNQLSEDELEFVRRALADEQSREDRYTLIHILWKACDALQPRLPVTFLFPGIGAIAIAALFPEAGTIISHKF